MNKQASQPLPCTEATQFHWCYEITKGECADMEITIGRESRKAYSSGVKRAIYTMSKSY